MLFRNHRLVRAIACFFLLELIGNLALPTVTLAMMGPSQPEFTSYESAGSTDMVNLSTGDFSFSLPAIDIPGPERSFSLPLTYKAGIQLEQEASWVGLGWSLNGGAIARSVNGYPDDANNEPIRMTYNKNVDRGWTSNIAGLIQLGWNSQTGHYGSVDLLGLAKVGWDKDGFSEADLVGLSYSTTNGFNIDPVRMASAAYTIATFGSASIASVAANIGIQAATSQAMTVGLRALGLGAMGGVAGFNNEPTRQVDSSHPFHDDYWDFFNNHTTENTFGALHFGKMSQSIPSSPNSQYNTSPKIRIGSATAPWTRLQPFHHNRLINELGNDITETAADVYQDGELRDNPPRRTEYGMERNTGENSYYMTSNRPISIAHDYFSVMGEQVSGSIRPYRLEVGSIAYPKIGVDADDNTGDDKIYHYKYMAVPFLDDYKVGFRYENALSNTYTYHESAAPAGHEAEGFDQTVSTYNVPDQELTITDPKLYNARTEPASPSRKGLRNSPAAPAERQLVHGKHVVWYTNAEIKALYANPALRSGSSFLEFDTPTTAGASNNTFRDALPPSGIGAFAVTAEDGTTYHYSLPVYQFKTYSKADEENSTIGDPGYSTRITGESGSTNPNNTTGASATTWLLTAITSSDYIDRNGSGTVDAADWGGWVQFKYGKFSAQYKWRQPYLGTSYSDESTTITSRSYTEGFKETYYLNSIATRTHTALFVKSIREDGRGHFQPGVGAGNSNLGIDEQLPASSLRLEEVILIDNATLAKLQIPDGIRDAGDPTAVPALSNATYPSHTLKNTLRTTDHLEDVLDTSDFSDWNAQGEQDGRIRNFIYAHCIKRTHFNYDYSLCRGIPSSFTFNGTTASLPLMDEAHSATGRSGKLTLKSVSLYGPYTGQNVNKIAPDFVFEYGKILPGVYNGVGSVADANPGYQKEKWDAFGMYCPDATRSISGHKPNQYNDYKSPWSLTKIISPLGGVTEIEYERDQYAHVSEFGTKRIHLSNGDCGSTLNASMPSGGTMIDLTTVLRANQTIYVSGTARFSNCVINTGTYGAGQYAANRVYNSTPLTVSSVSSNQLVLTASLTPDTRPHGGTAACDNPPVGQGADLDIVVPANVVGGDVRVAQITTSTGDRAYRVRYKYVDDISSTANGLNGYNSTGVIAKEPAFLNRFERPANGMFDYPTTPVIYGKVTVLRGGLGSDVDYDSREVYTFYTPTTDMVSEVSPRWRLLNSTSGHTTAPLAASSRVEVRTGLIGQAKEISSYNKSGQQELLTKFTYGSDVKNPDNIAKQGQFTEGVLNTEYFWGTFYINRSTKTYLPTFLSFTESYRNGVGIKNENNLFDFYTGQVLETSFKNSRNEYYHSRSIPAYYLYAGMGAKGDNIANSHMLAQQAASYTIKEKAGGRYTYNPLDFLNPEAVEVLSASVQTWKSQWSNYRVLSTGSAASGYADAADSPRPVWREESKYQWQSPLLNPNGSFSNFVDYNWVGVLDNHWMKTNEAVRYDHYSHLLESKDLNNQYSAQKLGYNQSQQIASASNARFTELAYSGAEDIEAGNASYFGGEVTIGGAADPNYAHTGGFSNRLNGPGDGFIYRARAGTNFTTGDVLTGKPYRLSVWVRSANGGGVQNAQLFATSAGTILNYPWVALAEQRQAGAWYRLTMNVTLPASATEVTFGCRNTGSGTLYFDDFRLCPLNSIMTSRVYNPQNNNLTDALDNENLYTHFEYNSIGRLLRLYKETFDRPGITVNSSRLIKEYAYNYARTYEPIWVAQDYRCEIDASGNYTGREERLEVDVNPANTNPAPSRWVYNGTSSKCARPPVCPAGPDGAPARLINNQCEYAVLQSAPCQACTSIRDSNGNIIARSSVTYNWVWPTPGPSIPPVYSGCAPGVCGGGGQSERNATSTHKAFHSMPDKILHKK